MRSAGVLLSALLICGGCGESRAAPNEGGMMDSGWRCGNARDGAISAGSEAARAEFAAGNTKAARPAEVRTAVTDAADSILPMDMMIERFQAELPRVTSLGAEASRSRDELIARFAAAVEDYSAAGLESITLNTAEFAHLYFPTSIYARGPYAQPPAVNWLLLEQNSLKGRTRLLRHYGGKRLVVEGHECAGRPSVEGRNRIYERCTLWLRLGDGRLEDVRLFGSILERDGRFKLMSLANRL